MAYTNNKKKKKPQNCESCQFYDYDEDSDSYICTVNLDEDEAVDFITSGTGNCHFYRFYDEYKSVQKQN